MYCIECFIPFSEEKFGHTGRFKKDGGHCFKSSCNKCLSKKSIKYHHKNRKECLKRLSRYYWSHKIYIRDQRRKHYINNREKIINRSVLWAKNNIEKVKENRNKHSFKIKARSILNRAVKAGFIKKFPCHNCGNKIAHAHHSDYSKPLKVIWLCPPCHSAEHRKIIPLHKI